MSVFQEFTRAKFLARAGGKPGLPALRILLFQPLEVVTSPAAERLGEVRDLRKRSCRERYGLESTFDRITREIDGPGISAPIEEDFRILEALQGDAVKSPDLHRSVWSHEGSTPFVAARLRGSNGR